MSGLASLRVGQGGQIGIATNALHDPGTIVTPDTFLPFVSEAVADSVTEVRLNLIGGTLGPSTSDVLQVDEGVGAGPITHAWLTRGFVRPLWHLFGGYDFQWPGSTRAQGTLTLAAIPTAGDTMTIGDQTYEYVEELTAPAVANEILIAGSIALQTSYTEAAINRGVATDGAGSGQAFATNTSRNVDVSATSTATTVVVADRQSRGTAVNSGGASEVATTETFTAVGNVWGAATLAGGVNGTDTRRRAIYTLDPLRWLEHLATVQIVRTPSSAPRVPWTYVGKVVSAQISCAMDGALMFVPTWDMISRTLGQAIAAASYPSGAAMFPYTRVTAKIDDVAEPVQGVSTTVNTNQQSRREMGAASRRSHRITAQPTITGELTREFENTTIYQAWIAGTLMGLDIEAIGLTIPGSVSPFRVLIECPAVRFTGSTPNVGGPGVVPNNIPFEVLDNQSDPWIQVTVDSDDGFIGLDG